MEMLLDSLKWSVIVGVLALLLTLLRPAFEKRYSARWRYWLWLVLAALALLAPVQWEALVPAVPTVSTPVVIDVPELELQVVQGDRVSVSLRPAVTAPESLPPATQRTFRLDEVLPAVWLAGAAVFALYTLAGTWLFRHRARRWSRKPKEETVRVYESIRQDMGLKRAPLLRVSTAAGSPMLTGIFHPCLLLPSENWSERELTFILRHELTHYRRHDLWYKSVLLAANAIHWFNPLVYLMRKEAGADLELTCDGAVMAGADWDTRRAYSETLLAAVRQDKSIGTSLSTHFYGGKEVMKERFRNILGKQTRKWGALALTLTLLAAAVSACAFGLRQEEQEPPPGKEEEAPPSEDGAAEELGLTGEPGQSVQGTDVVRYSNGGLSLALPAEYAGQFLVNPPERPAYSPYDPAHLVFSVYHRDTYLNEEASLYNGYVMSIERYTEDEFETMQVFFMEYGYPFASDGSGNIYCAARRHDVTVPPEAEDAMWQFLNENLERITDDFAEYNALIPYNLPFEPLSQAELAEFERYFNDSPLLNGLLRFPYNSVDEVKPYFQILFYDAGEPVTDEAERRAAAELFEEGLETDCFKLTTGFIVNAFSAYFAADTTFGVDWFDRELGPDMQALWGPYLQEYDAYYTQHGDTNMAQYTFVAGEKSSGGDVTLDYTANIYSWDGTGFDIEWDQPMRITLQSTPDGWKAVANQRTKSDGR